MAYYPSYSATRQAQPNHTSTSRAACSARQAFAANYMVFWGVLFHYIIASVFSIVFFLLYPNLKRVINDKYILAFVFGLIIWMISTFAILPLSNVPDIKGVPKYPWQLNLMAAIISLAGLSLCLGLPIALIADKYYRKNGGSTTSAAALNSR